MPLYKYRRDDVIRPAELEVIIAKAGQVSYMGLPGPAWQAFFSILWLFGKRVSEVIGLGVNDMYVEESDLVIRFIVLKKRRPPSGVRRRYTKRITLENPYTQYVLDWWHVVKDSKKFLFPRPQTSTGHIHRQYVNHVLKEIGNNLSPHLFRHSVATQMAENKATSYEMLNWFDWDQTDSALKYIRRSGRLTTRLSNRKW